MHALRTRAPAVALIAALASPAFPAEASGSIREAASREATRLGLEAVAQPPLTGDRAWAQLRELPPGESVDLTTREWHRAARVFVAADSATVVLIHANATGVSTSLGRHLQLMAERAPHLLVNATRGETIIDGTLRISRDGIFVEGRRLSSLSGVIETRTRDEIEEIAVYRRGGGFFGHLSPLGGYFVGALGGGYGAGLLCQAVRGKQGCDTGAFLTGMLVGGVFGASYGYHSGRRVQRYVVYRAVA